MIVNRGWDPRRLEEGKTRPDESAGSHDTRFQFAIVRRQLLGEASNDFVDARAYAEEEWTARPETKILQECMPAE